MKFILSLIALFFAVPFAQAQVVVTNPASDMLSQVLHTEDIAKTVEMINNQVKQITTLTQQLQQIQSYVKAFGDPAKLTQITGADQLISSLKESGVGKTISELQKLSSGVEALQYNANGLYQSLGNTFTTPGGTSVSRSTDLYKKFGAVQQGAENFQTVTDDVLTRRKKLRSQIAETTQQLQAATTNAETQKLTGVLVGYNAELQAVDREIDHAAAQVTTQDAENRADSEKQEQALREERQAQMEEGVKRYSEVFKLESSAPKFPTNR